MGVFSRYLYWLNGPRERRGDFLYIVALIALVGLWLGIGLSRLEKLSWEDDEGTFLVTAQAVFAGHRLYRDVWFNYLPGFVGVLIAAFVLGGVTVEAARSAIVLFGGLLLIGLAELARRLGGRKAGLLVPLLLVMAPNFVRLGRAVMAEVPAAAFTVWAVLAALLYLRSGRWPWLMVAGLLTSGGILIKYPTVVTAVPVASAVFLRSVTADQRISTRLLSRHLALLALSVGAPIVISVLPFGLPSVWDQMLDTYLSSRATYHVVLGENMAKLAEYLAENNWGLVLLACGGVVGLSRRGRAEAGLIALWAVSYLVSMLGHSPLMEHHLFLILAPITLMAGIGLGQLAGLRSSMLRGHRWLLLAGPALGLFVYVLGLPEMLDVTIGRLQWAGGEQQSEWEAVHIVAQYTAPGDYVVSDFPMIPFRAQRQTPPWLTNLSGMRFRTGGITDHDLLQNMLDYQVRAVVMWENKLYQKAPQYVDWVEQSCRPAYGDIAEDHADQNDDKVRRILICPEFQPIEGAALGLSPEAGDGGAR